ncbi:MAG: terminase [Actinobacteria bacterium]|nr:terminase [Actinomycetota bacterium]
MTTKSPTKTSTRRLSDVARYIRIPDGIVTSGWPAVARKLSEWGVFFRGSDAWEDGLGRLILGKRADGKYAATVGGIVLRIPRQVAKTWFVGRLLFALCVLFPGLQVVWTAHHTATLTKTFQSLSTFAKRRKVAPYVGDPETGKSGIKRGSGKEAILFLNGSAIWFGARDQGFGRGFEMIDVLVFDEAQILNPKALEDLIAATNQAQHVHGGLVFYMGTPPRPTDPGATFDLKRVKALTGLKPGTVKGILVGGNMIYVECSAHPNIGRDGGPSLDDRGEWRTANPSYPERTPEESMLRMRENLPSDDAWRREAMGVSDDDAMTQAGIDMSVLRKLVLGKGTKLVPQMFALDVSPKRSAACIVASGWCGTKVGVEIPSSKGLFDHRPGIGWLPERMRALSKAFPDAVWVIVTRSQAAAYLTFLLNELEVDVLQLSSADWPGVCASMVGLIEDGTLAHTGDEELMEAFGGAVLVNVGEEQVRWGRQKSSTDITPVVAATAAAVMAYRDGDQAFDLNSIVQ